MVLLSQVKVALEPAPAPHPILHLQPQQLLQFQQWHLVQQPYSPPPLYPFQAPQAHLHQFPQHPAATAAAARPLAAADAVDTDGTATRPAGPGPEDNAAQVQAQPRCLDMTQQWRVSNMHLCLSLS